MWFATNWVLLVVALSANKALGGDDDYSIVRKDGSFDFGYETPDSYHTAEGNRNNVVRGEFGGRNPSTGAIDTTIYTAGPRGYRPRGKNIHRKYDLNQNGPRAPGSRDDPYYDPFEDPSYSFGFKTRTYNRQENQNRVGDVTGKYSFVDDVGERHNVEYIAGKNTGFHVKTPYPDSNPRAFGPLFFRGRGKPIPRGRTSIQRGLDGSYRFVSAGPDQRRTETSDSTGHVRGSYTYLDDKGVQHSVHYIAGPETGYRVLKNVKGPHLPSVYPFGHPDIIPSDFYDYIKDPGDLFDIAASGDVRPSVKPPSKPQSGGSDDGLGSGFDVDKNEFDNNLSKPDQGVRPSRPRPSGSGLIKPSGARPITPTEDPLGEDSGADDFDLFGGGGGSSTSSGSTTSRPSGSDDGSYKPSLGSDGDDGSYIPPGDVNQDDGKYKPSETPKPGLGGADSAKPSRPFNRPAGRPTARPKPPTDYDDDDDDQSLFGSSSSHIRPPIGGGTIIQVQGGSDGNGPPPPGCERCKGTIVTNVGDKLFSVPPGVSVRAHVQSIDLLPILAKVPSPSEQFKEETSIKTEQLNSAASNLISNSEKEQSITTTMPPPTTTAPAISTTTQPGSTTLANDE